MKKLLLATAIAALSVSAANAAPTLYGKVSLSVDVVDSDISDSTDVSLNSTASRIGLKGSEALTANTDVIYQLEYVVNPDDADGKQFESRDTYIGFKNNTAGTFKFGRNSSVTDGINNVQQAFGGIQGTVSGIADGNRVDNSMIWTAPTAANLPVQLNLMASTEENFGDAGYGASVMFDQGAGYTLGLAYTDTLDADAEVLRVTGSYDMAKTMAIPAEVGIMYQQADWNNVPGSVKEKELMVTGAYSVANTPWTVWAEFDQAKDWAGIDDAKITKIAVGGRYAFNQVATGHIYAGNVDYKNVFSVDGDDMIVGTGIEYKF
ncbi:putative porin [Psychrobacter luti]|uniref:Putative porin n=1 Tax=Psychrobacter luti TaxID=198481 RepID=A0A839TGQ9_9GAMM|nr:porin [Psychrobacter luti]MBB3107204.1 putative porin [Psychrobacter luti]